VQNTLRSAERRKRISSDEAGRIWLDLGILDLRIVPHPEMTANPRLLELSRRYGITVYDASYLDVAMQVNLPLADQ
jgi:predicted nucleic acid-binding protein